MSKKLWIYPGFIFLASVLWGLDGVVLRPALYSLPVTVVVFLEHALAFVIMIPFLIWERKKLKQISKKEYFYFFLVALFGGTLGGIFITKGLFYVNFANLSAVLLMQKLQPIFAIFLAWVLLKEKMPKKFFLFAGLALLGAYAIAFPNLIPNFSTGDKTAIASLFGLLAAMSWGASTVFSKAGIKTTNFRIATYIRYGLTTFIVSIFLLASNNFSAFSQVNPTQWKYIFIIIFSSGAVAMLLYYFGLKKTRASVSTICELGLPLSAIVFEWLFYHQTLSYVQFIGGALLLFAIIKVSKLRKTVSNE